MSDALRVPCPVCHVDAGESCIGLCVPAPRDPHEARGAHARAILQAQPTEPPPPQAVFAAVPARVGPRDARMAHALDRSIDLVGRMLTGSTFESITDNVSHDGTPRCANDLKGPDGLWGDPEPTPEDGPEHSIERAWRAAEREDERERQGRA